MYLKSNVPSLSPFAVMNEFDVPVSAWSAISVQERLHAIHTEVKSELPDITRIAVAVYDDRADTLKTFVHSTDGSLPFTHYEAHLSDVPTLRDLARDHHDRVIDDLAHPLWSSGKHNKLLVESGYRSSYTLPFYEQGALFGFIFFDAERDGVFTEAVLRHLSVFAHYVSLLIINALMPPRALRSAVEVVREMSHFHDVETGAHLDRMARFARLIAKYLADQDPDDSIDDEFVEFVFLFAPLHDVGKVAIRDEILMKPSSLTPEEFQIMKTHVAVGCAIVERIANSFGVAVARHISVLRNIVRYHHENYDGTGYLEGLKGTGIPLEARIISVADVFDALTSQRRYKRAWSNDEAFTFLRQSAGMKFDPACVAALESHRADAEEIQARFRNTDGFQGFHEAYMDGL